VAKKDKPVEKVYSKSQILQSKQFTAQRDVLKALLRDGVNYTKNEAISILGDFLTKEAK